MASINFHEMQLYPTKSDYHGYYKISPISAISFNVTHVDAEKSVNSRKL